MDFGPIETLIVGEPAVGDVVQVSGRILADGTLSAETITLVDEELGLPFSFVGLVEVHYSGQSMAGADHHPLHPRG